MSATPSALTATDTPSPVGQGWGRVLLCGGTDWPRLGRKDRGGKKKEDAQEIEPGPDLLEPHILRSLSVIKAVSIHTSCIGCHCVVLDIDGAAWLFGRNERSALGAAGVEAISENAPKRLTAQKLGASKDTRFIHAACGKNHTLLVGSDGQVWTAGINTNGQCGHPVCPEISSFKLVNGPKLNGVKERVKKAAAGTTFSIVLTESGKVFAFGSAEHGQLGHGKTGEHIVSAGKTAFDIEWEPIPVRGLDNKQIVQIACGAQHSIALDVEGMVYVWGYNGYCRLGLGHQKDILIPQVVPNFAGSNEMTRGAEVVAGPSNSVVIDKQRMYWMAGKWKNTGDGSVGQPNSSFRYIGDLMGCKILQAACGGVSHWALAPDDDDCVMTIVFGQGASNGELGLGPDEPKSITKPTQHKRLIGIHVLQVAAGQNTTFFLAKPNAKLSDLPRHPFEVEAPDACVVCGKDNGDDDPLLECEKCDYPYHLKCLDPPLSEVPEGEWFCPECEADPGAPIDKDGVKRNTQSEEDEGSDEEEPKQGIKRKAAGKGSSTATKRRK
ncbi:RCC1/BLIP-II protein [Obba rivulosa]|uniref:RCC1/BLIP-II protein n=1 Tax=Obba rivulosa TaxID=1052685 RepID=A0A8E2DVF7_9APHY|nr:RCC1/BLIP-II protein [Obba rivulosa]